MLYLDVQYLKRVSFRLDRFKEKKNTGNTYNAQCRCNICGDSQKNERKTRGNFYSHQNHLMYKCFNCDASLHFGTWLKEFDLPMWQEWKLEQLKHNQQANPPKKEDSTVVDQTIVDNLLSMDFALSNHTAKKYILDRKIPKKFWSDLFYVPEFHKWSLGHTNKFEGIDDKYEHPRLLIPWRDETGRIFAYQARALVPHDRKYYAIVMDKSVPRLFGMDRLDWKKTIYVVEGPIDSMFIDNCIAVGTSALLMFETDKQEVVYLPDNECRNPEILKVYAKIINANKNIVIPPDTYHYKDINEAVMDNFDIKSMIDYNTFNGLSAKMRFLEWKKVDYDN